MVCAAAIFGFTNKTVYFKKRFDMKWCHDRIDTHRENQSPVS